MILVIDVCKERLHAIEFVKPVTDILEKADTDYVVKQYEEVSKDDLAEADKVIICGTSLEDGEYLERLELFEWLKDFTGAVLGICAGMQIMAHIFGGRLLGRGRKTKISEYMEVGMVRMDFKKEFLGITGAVDVYLLHQLGVGAVGKGDAYAKTKKSVQAVKWNTNKYGVLFHPEVRNKNMIENFTAL